MQDFDFANPTRILFGRNRHLEAGSVARSFASRVLVVSGRGSVHKSGLYQRIVGCLEAEGVEVFTLEGVQSNPVLPKVVEGIGSVQKEGIEAILALGGGSVMDTSKAVAAGALLEEGRIWECFLGRRPIERALPVIAIPTLAASGSEMNGHAVITNPETGHKLATGSPHLYPKVAILDPTLTYSVPRDYTAYGGLDAVCHLLEPYFNGPDPNTPLQDRMAEGMIRALIEATDRALDAPRDFEARSTLMWGASLALCGLTRAGVGDVRFPVHLMEHALSALYEIPHGAGLAALLPGWMAWRAKRNSKKIRQFGRRVLDVPPSEPKRAVSETVARFRTWLSRAGCPTSLKDIAITPHEHRAIAENAFFQASIWGISEVYSVETLQAILGYCQG